MNISSVNAFSSLHPALGDAGSDTTGTGNDHAVGRPEAFCLSDFPASVVAAMGGLMRAALDGPECTPPPVPEVTLF